MSTARQRLGEVISFALKESGKGDHDVSHRVGVSTREVESWRAGTATPNNLQWKKLCQMISRSLWQHAATQKEAMRELEEERDATVRALQRNGHAMKTSSGQVVTNFGDKLVAAVIAKPEPPAAESPAVATGVARRVRQYATLPPGAKQPDNVLERREFARSILMQRPAITSRGDDGLIELVRKRFGVGMSDVEVRRIREEVERDAIEREVRAKISQEQLHQAPPPAVAPTPPPAPVPVVTVTAAVNDADVSAGVELIVGAVPGLQEMTIRVDDAGVVTVNYDVRKVQVTKVSAQLTVRR